MSTPYPVLHHSSSATPAAQDELRRAQQTLDNTIPIDIRRGLRDLEQVGQAAPSELSGTGGVGPRVGLAGPSYLCLSMKGAGLQSGTRSGTRCGMLAVSGIPATALCESPSHRMIVSTEGCLTCGMHIVRASYQQGLTEGLCLLLCWRPDDVVSRPTTPSQVLP